MAGTRNDTRDCCTSTTDDRRTEGAAGTSGTSCCTVPLDPAPDACAHSSDTTDVLSHIGSEEDSEDLTALRAAGFNLLLTTGRPVRADDLAAATGITPDRVAQILELARAGGRAELDDQTRLVGIAGLTLTPGRHELDIAGEKRWAWCALDAVGILGALEATGTVHSIDPHSGRTVAIDVVAGSPKGDATLFIVGGYDGRNVREKWCPLVNFFATRTDAEAWVADNKLNGDIVSVTQVAEDAAAMWRPVIDPAAFLGG